MSLVPTSYIPLRYMIFKVMTDAVYIGNEGQIGDKCPISLSISRIIDLNPDKRIIIKWPQIELIAHFPLEINNPSVTGLDYKLIVSTSERSRWRNALGYRPFTLQSSV